MSPIDPTPRSSAVSEPVRVAIAVVRRGDDFLVGTRAAGLPLAGLWEFPGGKIQPGESPQEAAARECREETGLDIIVGEAYPEVRHDYNHAPVQLFFFACVPRDAAAVPQPPFRWVTSAELASLVFPAANGPLIDHLVRTVQS